MRKFMFITAVCVLFLINTHLSRGKRFLLCLPLINLISDKTKRVLFYHNESDANDCIFQTVCDNCYCVTSVIVYGVFRWH